MRVSMSGQPRACQYVRPAACVSVNFSSFLSSTGTYEMQDRYTRAVRMHAGCQAAFNIKAALNIKAAFNIKAALNIKAAFNIKAALNIKAAFNIKAAHSVAYSIHSVAFHKSL
jgi:hypothetical protein